MFERVFTVWDYFDGPRRGLAAYQGKPHLYMSNWDSLLDDYADTFALAPVDQETLGVALAQWHIWKTWEIAFHRQEVSRETHPGHGGKDPRYDELRSVLTARLADARKLDGAFMATWRALEGQEAMPDGVMRDLEVEWTAAT